MKIRIVQDFLRSGGTERQSIWLGKFFRQNGHDTRLITFRPGGALADTLGDLPQRALQRKDTGFDFWAPGLTRAVLADTPDIVLCMGRMANCWAGFLARAAARAHTPARVIGTMRTGKSLPWFYRRSLQRVAHVIANSSDAGDALVRKYGVPAEKISVIRNALVFSPASTRGKSFAPFQLRNATRENFGAKEDDRVLLCVGMFRPEKNQRALIEIVRQLLAEIPWQLWFAGDGETRAACEELAKTHQLSDRVRFLGFQADPSSLYLAADVAVTTSQRESLSNFLIEAHAHGLPSVAFSVGGVNECGGVTVPCDDNAAFAAALLRFLRDDTLRKNESTRVAAYARTHFAPEAQGRAYLELFERLKSADAISRGVRSDS